jgi:alcohol dehydrogenase
MRSYRLEKPSSGLSGLVMRDEPMPAPQRGEVLVKIHAVSLNYRDVSMVQGDFVSAVTPGLVPCSDAAGEIIEVGQDVAGWAPGDRVISAFHPRWFGGRPPVTGAGDTYGNGRDGWLCEYKAVSQEAIVRHPASLSSTEGATLPCAGLTAWASLNGPTPIRTGDTVLTLGSGGVSVFAIQLARALGATVIGTTSNDRKAAALTALGVDQVVKYTEVEHWGRHVRTLTGGGGVDCVVEVGGPGTFAESLDAVRWGGEIAVIGFLSKQNPGIDYFRLKASGAIVRPIGAGDRGQLEDLVRAVDGAGIKPVVDREFAFEDAVDAYAHLQQGGHIGKIVIRVGG